MSQPADRVTPNQRDAGFTLPELLIAMMISGILVVSISMAFTTVLRTQTQATDRLAESKDITFVQTWLPVDLSSAIDSFSMVGEPELNAALAAAHPADGVQRDASRRERAHRHPTGSRGRWRRLLPRRLPVPRGQRQVAAQSVTRFATRARQPRS